MIFPPILIFGFSVFCLAAILADGKSSSLKPTPPPASPDPDEDELPAGRFDLEAFGTGEVVPSEIRAVADALEASEKTSASCSATGSYDDGHRVVKVTDSRKVEVKKKVGGHG